MQYSNILLVGATFGAALAQARIGFTKVPTSVQAGVPTVLEWSGGDDTQTTTITLKNGDSNNLNYVSTIAPNVPGTKFTWKPSQSLANGYYAFEIAQGNDLPNYSGMFTLSGGSNKAIATTSSASITSSSSSSASTTVTKTTPLAALPLGKSASSTSASTTVTKTTPLAALTGNSTTLAPKNGTAPTTVLLGTGFGTGVGTGASSAGTGTAMHRNTTMSKPTLSSTKSSSTAKSTSAGSKTSSSSSSTGSSTGAPSSAAYQIGSPVALILSVFAAMVYLG